MKIKTKKAPNFKSSLFNELKQVYLILGKKGIENIPKTMLNLSKELLAISPNTFLFKAVEIKEYYETPDKELDACFPGDYFLNEDYDLKSKIFEFLYQNFKEYNNNELIIKGIKNIIDQIPYQSTQKKYDRLINTITKNMSEEDGTLCRLLATSPLKYKELTYHIVNSLNSSPLPKKASDFYALKNYTENEKKIKASYQKIQEDELKQLKAEFHKTMKLQNERMLQQDERMLQLDEKILQQDAKILQQDAKIKNLKSDISQLKKELQTTKNTLFKIQVRDAIKVFIKQIKWSFHIYDRGNIKDLITPILNEITNGKDEVEKKGAKMIINLLKKLDEIKSTGNDKGHTIINEGFKEDILPEEVRQKYILYKKAESNCSASGCDCIALLLSIQEINDSNQSITQKRYDLFKDIFNVPTRDKSTNFLKVQKLLLSYQEGS